MNRDWLAPRLAEALAAGDPDEVAVLERLAGRQGIALTEAERAGIAALRAANSGLVACGRCAVSPDACAGLAQLASCNLPFEFTPAGDANALRRAARDHAAGREVDRVEAALAGIGLAATGAVLVSGGAALPVKAGASALRAARRAGALSRPLARHLEEAAAGVIRWDRAGDVLRLRARPAALVDAGRAAGLAALAGDLARIRAATSTADALALLRLADTPADVTRLARVAEAAGEGARPALRALGKARAFRLLARLSRLTLAAVVLLAALAAQLAALAGHLLGRALLRTLRHRWTARPRPATLRA